MKRERKSPPRLGPNALNGDGKGRMQTAYVGTRVTNRTDPSIPGSHTGA